MNEYTRFSCFAFLKFRQTIFLSSYQSRFAESTCLPALAPTAVALPVAATAVALLAEYVQD